MRPVIVAVAITGSVPRKADNPAVPISVSEQIESTQAAYDKGASLVHIHVREDDETPSSNPERFAAVQAGISRHCPDMVIQFSTGGRGRDPAMRGSALKHQPDMASLSTGSVNFPTIVYENHVGLVEDLATSMRRHGVRPEIEIFDLSHLHGARRLADARMIDERPHIQFVLGVKNALPAEERLLDILVAETERLFPLATWTAAGIGRYQSLVMHWAMARGADAVRTGLEDNIRVSRNQLAQSNAQLVHMACEVLDRYGARPSSACEARQILRLGEVDAPLALPDGPLAVPPIYHQESGAVLC